jgi:hypothetical protein
MKIMWIKEINWLCNFLKNLDLKVWNIIYSYSLYHITWFELTTLVVIGTDCIGSCKSSYHTIKATTAP